MDRRIVWAARAGTRRELVQRDVGALARDRRGQLLRAVAMSRADTALAGADDRDLPPLVQAQELREAELEPAGDPRRDRERRTRLIALDLGVHRRARSRARAHEAWSVAHISVHVPQ